MMLRALISFILVQQVVAIFDSDVYSVFYDLNTVSEKVKLNKKCMVYVGSNHMDPNEEKTIMLVSPEGTKVSVYDASNHFNSDRTLKPVFVEAVEEFTINNLKRFKYDAPIIYAVEEGADNHVFLSREDEDTQMDLNGTSIHDTYMTILSPKQHTTITSLNGTSIFQMAWLTLSAGGAKEARKEDFQLLDLGKMMGKSGKEILLLEPVVTVRQTASLPGSISMSMRSKEFHKTGGDIIEIKVDWGDTVVAMSSGYKLEKEHSVSYHSLQYVFEAKHNNTQFDVELTGSIYEDAAITFRKRGYDGVGIEGFSEKENLQNELFSFKGEQLQLFFDVVDDKFVENRHSKFFSIINIGKSGSFASFALVSMLFVFTFL